MKINRREFVWGIPAGLIVVSASQLSTMGCGGNGIVIPPLVNEIAQWLGVTIDLNVSVASSRLGFSGKIQRKFSTVKVPAVTPTPTPTSTPPPTPAPAIIQLQSTDGSGRVFTTQSINDNFELNNIPAGDYLIYCNGTDSDGTSRSFTNEICLRTAGTPVQVHRQSTSCVITVNNNLPPIIDPPVNLIATRMIMQIDKYDGVIQAGKSIGVKCQIMRDDNNDLLKGIFIIINLFGETYSLPTNDNGEVLQGFNNIADKNVGDHNVEAYSLQSGSYSRTSISRQITVLPR